MLAALAVLHGAPVSAEFIKHSSLTWVASTEASTSGVTTIPFSSGSGHPSGLFIFATDEKIPVQSFHPSKLQTDKTESCFLRYAADKRAFTELVIPHGKQYEITGNVTIRLGDSLRVSISTENGSVPFVSIIQESDPSSVVSFLGTDFAVKGEGARRESYLDAGVRSTTEVFEIKKQQLMLQGIMFGESKIGLPNQSTQSNTCLTKGVMVVSHAQYTEYQKSGQSAEIKRQLRAIQNGEDLGILQQKYVILNVISPTVAVVLDGYGKIGVVNEVKERVGDIPVCTINELP